MKEKIASACSTIAYPCAGTLFENLCDFRANSPARSFLMSRKRTTKNVVPGHRDCLTSEDVSSRVSGSVPR